MSIGGLTDQADARARSEVRRQHQIRIAHRAGWDEIPRRNLLFQPFGVVIDEPSGTGYVINKGEVSVDSGSISAYFISEHGDPVFLEKRAKR